jgi:hypothetical protein
MSTGALIGTIIVVIVVAAVIVVAGSLVQRARMRRQFGPEYDRLASELGPRKAQAELTARQHRVESLGIHPLSADQQAIYSSQWTAVQERFVDSPAAAVSSADTLIWDVMRDRGYPADDRKASMEALSVYHARPLDGYRQAQDVRADSATTEGLRETMLRYRTLFEDLIGARVGDRQLQRAGRLQRDATAQNGRAATGTSELAAGNSQFAAEHSDRTADTPR